ncbi:MAG TPA: rRNA adenine dimethyltransferase family protein [Rectinemataceae bacterium]|nr:rRNA adenine dimethyltransferase family protein [Rectinemataceae bacterium]
MTIAYDSPASIKTFLEASGLAMSKRFGQNFLVDPNAREKLYAALGTNAPVHVWEIGPGIGAMTSLLLERGHYVTAFEIDHGFARILRELFGDNPRFRLVEGDFLKTWRGALDSVASSAGAALVVPSNSADAPGGAGVASATSTSSAKPDIIFGNLPYNVALAIIADLLENNDVPGRMIFTVQKEAARRIASGPGTKDYSAFSVLCSSVCRTKILYDIGAAAFWPRPRVTSSVVSLSPRPDPIAAEDRSGFSRFVRSAFSSRRKTLRNNVNAMDNDFGGKLDETLTRLGIQADIRAEALDPEHLAAVYFALSTSR